MSRFASFSNLSLKTLKEGGGLAGEREREREREKQKWDTEKEEKKT